MEILLSGPLESLQRPLVGPGPLFEKHCLRELYSTLWCKTKVFLSCVVLE